MSGERGGGGGGAHGGAGVCVPSGLPQQRSASLPDPTLHHGRGRTEQAAYGE